MASAELSRKRKRVSKNKKKNWRKTDINDVEELLEEERLQERTGGLVAEKTDEQLFFVDKSKEETVEDTVAPKRRKRSPKPLRCHANLEPDPRIKPAKIKHNVPKESDKKKCINKLNASGPTAKEITSLAERKKAKDAGKQKLKVKRFDKIISKDLWGDSDINTLPEDIDEHFAKVTRKKRVARPVAANKKVSEYVAVEAPLPGQSYNPTYEDHQELLRNALTVEVKKVKEEAKIKRALDDKFPTPDKAPNAGTYIEEMSAGLFDEGDAAVTEEDLAAISSNPAVRREDKKTEKQRKKALEHKKRESERLKLKEEKQKKNEIYRLKSLAAEVKRSLLEHEKQVNKRQEERDLKKYRTKKLGKLKYEEPNLALKLSDELEGSLRLLKPEGNLLEDRYKALQKRNIIEPRARQKVVRKYKPKQFEKKGHKEITI